MGLVCDMGPGRVLDCVVITGGGFEGGLHIRRDPSFHNLWKKFYVFLVS